MQANQAGVHGLELIWRGMIAGAIVVPVLVGMTIPAGSGGSAIGEALFLAALVASLPAWLVKRHFDARIGSPEFRALPPEGKLGRVRTAMIIGLALAELPMYVGLAHYLVTGQVIGITILTMITAALMLLFHPSRIARAR